MASGCPARGRWRGSSRSSRPRAKAGVVGRRIRVLGGYFNSTATATAIFLTTGVSAALTPKIVIYGGFVLPSDPLGYFQTAVGSALSLQIEGGSVGGFITYAESF